MSFVDRVRASRLMAAAGLDALVVAEPESFAYVAGQSQGVGGLFRRAGAGFAILPADPAIPIGVVIGDLYAEAALKKGLEVRSHPLWIETGHIAGLDDFEDVAARIVTGWHREGRPTGFERPATFSLHLAIDSLIDLLGQFGMSAGRLGLDLDFVSESDAAVMRDGLNAAVISNGSPILDRIRMVKTQPEVDRLSLAVELAEAGLRRLTADIERGQTVADLHSIFRAGIEAEAVRRKVSAPPSWDYISIGPEPWGSARRVGPGLIVKADVGCVVDGYSSDTSRNFVFGTPTPGQAGLHDRLEVAFDAVLAEIRPGVALSALHRVATQSLEAGGLVGFSRGHFGHGLGNSLFSEQWPFISARNHTPIEAGMVLALEIPIYVSGLGGFNLEDQLLVTETSVEVMNSLPRSLLSLGA